MRRLDPRLHGDEPFGGRGWYGLGSVTGTRRYGDRDTLLLGIDFDGNRPIFPDTPLPVAVWTRRWNERLETSLGFPFLAATWRPAPRVTLELRGIPGVFVTGGASFRVREGVETFVGYRGASFRFFLEDIPNEHRRLFYDEDRVEAGVEVTVGRRWKVRLAGGWAFDREYAIGWDVRDKGTLARLDGAPFLSLAVEVTF